MGRGLYTLERVRSIEKRIAKNSFAEAERVRRVQEDRVITIEQQMEASRVAEALGADGGQACWVANEHAWRIRLEGDLRREVTVLERRMTEVRARRAELTDADRAHRVVESAIERQEAEAELEARRADGRRLDALAGVRWWREEHR
ncbi:MAG: hypothetical protein JNM72_06785 [Deltaproteobacteria bacterium]|jgi:flagellar export protein FliJ|nr:hypothetical protein [Deltaproteobacteria bacterium]